MTLFGNVREEGCLYEAGPYSFDDSMSMHLFLEGKMRLKVARYPIGYEEPWKFAPLAVPSWEGSTTIRVIRFIPQTKLVIARAFEERSDDRYVIYGADRTTVLAGKRIIVNEDTDIWHAFRVVKQVSRKLHIRILACWSGDTSGEEHILEDHNRLDRK